MTDVVRAPRGWGLWVIFGLGLASVPLNAFAILFWMWVTTHHVTETTMEDTIGAIAFGVLAAVVIGVLIALIRRWDRVVVALSLIQSIPAVSVLVFALVGLG